MIGIKRHKTVIGSVAMVATALIPGAEDFIGVTGKLGVAAYTTIGLGHKLWKFLT